MTVLERRQEDVGPRHRPGSGLGGRWATLTRAKVASASVLVLFVAVVSYLVVVPIGRLQVLAFTDGAFEAAFGTSQTAKLIGSTVGLALGSFAVAMILGTLLAIAANRLPRRLAFLQLLPILPIVIPAVASVVGWAFLLSPRPGYINVLLRKLPFFSDLTEGPVDIYQFHWIVFITGFNLSAFVFLFVNAGIKNISADILEAAEVAGAKSSRVFWTVTLPLLRPSLIYAGGVALLLGLGQFAPPLLLGTNSGLRVLTTEMYFQVTQTPVQMQVAAALGSPLLVFGVLVVFAQKQLLGDQKRFVTHTGRSFRIGGRPSYLGAAFILGFSILSTVLPLIALLFVSASKYWSGTLNFSALSFENMQTVLSRPAILSALTNSLVFSLVAMAIALPTGYLAANILLRVRGFRVGKIILDFVVALPLGVPAIIFGVGFLITYSEGPFVLYGTPWVVILAYVTLMLPYATRMLLSTMLSMGTGYDEASRVAGAGVWRTHTRILLPIMRPSISGAAALIFVLLTHEFTASLLVRASTTQVMGTVLFDYWNDGAYPLVATVALLMSLITALGVTIAVFLGGSDVLKRL